MLQRACLQLLVCVDLHVKGRIDEGEALRHVFHYSLAGDLDLPPQVAELPLGHNCHNTGFHFPICNKTPIFKKEWTRVSDCWCFLLLDGGSLTGPCIHMLSFVRRTNMQVQRIAILERLVLEEVSGSVAAAAHVTDFCVCPFTLADLFLPKARLLYDDA